MSEAVIVACIMTVPATITACGTLWTAALVRDLREEWRAWAKTHTSDGHGGDDKAHVSMRWRQHVPRQGRARAWWLSPAKTRRRTGWNVDGVPTA